MTVWIRNPPRTASAMTRGKPRITREQAIEQAVRNVVPDGGDLEHLETTLSMCGLSRYRGFTALAVAAIRAEFERLSKNANVKRETS